jgi:hypothetical protein
MMWLQFIEALTAVAEGEDGNQVDGDNESNSGIGAEEKVGLSVVGNFT